MKRFSLAGLGWSSPDAGADVDSAPMAGNMPHPSSSAPTAAPPDRVVSLSSPKGSSIGKTPEATGEHTPLAPQSTGGLWGNWWASPAAASSSDPASADRTKPKSAAWYVDNLKPGVLTGSKLAKHLISLRVHLSTAKLTWIERFVDAEKGMDVLGAVLERLVGKGSKRRKLAEIDDTILAEVVKCFRVLLNTEVCSRTAALA